MATGAGAEGANARAGTPPTFCLSSVRCFAYAQRVMRLTLLNKTAAILLTCLLGIAATAPQAEAAPKTPRITSVELDTDAGTMVVTGRDFGGKKFRGNVRLHLAETGPITLKVDKYKKLQPSDEVPILLQQLQLSGIPQNIDDFAGVHLLEVRRKYKEKVDGVSVVKFKVGTSLVTIGEQGPAGTDGVDGEQGPKGDKGDQGVAGPAGRDGADGAQGPKGDQGDAGADGTNGSDGVGVSQTTIDADGNLIVTLTNGNEINAGQVRGAPDWEQVFGYIDGNGANISADGNTVGVRTVRGNLYVFRYNGSSWQEIDDDINVGDVTGLSADGSTLVVGRLGLDGGAYIRVRRYEAENSSYESLGADINLDGEAFFDFDISISADGNTIAVSLDYEGTSVYRYNGSSWQQLGSDIIGNYAIDSGSISADGNTLAVEAYSYDETTDSYSDYVRVFRFNGSSWQQLGSDISDDSYDLDSPSISDDGNTMAVEVEFDDSVTGLDSEFVRVYRCNDSGWQQLGADINDVSYGIDDPAISADGTTVAVKLESYDDNTGAFAEDVRVYRYSDSSWQQLGDDILSWGNTTAGSSYFLDSLYMTADGNSLVFAGQLYDEFGSLIDAAVRVYELTQEP
jgi:hypothetical protein